MLPLGKNESKALFQNEYLELKYLPDSQLLMADWSGWLDTTRGKGGCNIVLEHTKSLGAKKLLNSNIKVTGHSGDTEWLSRVWLPSLSNAGIMYMAWLYSLEFFTQLQIDKAISHCESMTIQTFFAEEDALLWLEQF
jgi:hypothetical protein